LKKSAVHQTSFVQYGFDWRIGMVSRQLRRYPAKFVRKHSVCRKRPDFRPTSDKVPYKGVDNPEYPLGARGVDHE
jgi:hypothetical protein